MNKNIYKICIILTGILCQLSCSNDFEKVPVEEFTKDFVFSKTDSIGEKAKQYLNGIYYTLPNGHNRVGGDYLDAATDDAISSALGQTDVANLATGNYSSMVRIGSDMRWAEYYTAIRQVNTFVNNIDVVPLKMTFNGGQPMNRAWKSEARFVRAFQYFELIKRYGGVPIVPDHELTLEDDLELKRNTFEECVNYIVSELDAIKDSLRTAPVDNPQVDAHVVTKGAALALKSRVLLYAASPLFNGGNIDAQNPLTGYTNYDNSRWALAAKAAREFINELTYYNLESDFSDPFIIDGSREVIFYRAGGKNKNIEKNNAPIGFSSPNDSNGRTSPSQNLVEAFPMLDGKAIDAGSKYPYDASNQYANRDPRLDYTVLHNNSQWLKQNVQTFLGGNNNPNAGMQKTKTGYYMRKFMGHYENSSDYVDIRHDWVVFRYAEILLNFAEAENESMGATNDVYQMIKNLRKRAKIEAGTDGNYGLTEKLTKDDMRKIIQNERRIEMAFEEQRYWDVRRWKIANDVYSKPINGLAIVRAGGGFNYNTVPVLVPTFNEKRYLYPIPYSEVVKNKNMVQNPSW